MTLFERVHMPSFAGATEWLNSEPLGPAELKGHAVLVNFWTWTCINWLRQEPYVRAWSQAYRDDGLIVVGVHTPEFSFEHDIDSVRRAARERAIDYPVVVDNDYEVWSAFANHYWPALYFTDADGILRDQHFGEGRYERSERVIQMLLGVERGLVSVEGLGVEAAADWEHLGTPETYLGNARSDQQPSSNGAGLDDHRAYELPERLPLNQWALAGTWAIEPESVVLEQAGGSIAFRFAARDAHLVLSREAPEPIPFRVLIDGEAPGRSHGVNVDEVGNGALRDGRLIPARAAARRGPRPDAGDHLPPAGRQGVLVHLRVAPSHSRGCSDTPSPDSGFGAFAIFDFNRPRRSTPDAAVPIAAAIFLDVFNIFLIGAGLSGGRRE
jgi:thiol-disulfide isomerase/thioredoxin